MMLAIFYGLSALIFFQFLYRSKLIPRFISVWGLIGAALVLIDGTLLEVLGYDPGLVLGLPMALNEVFLGVWLIVKGFDSSTIASGSAKTDINEME